MSPFEALSRDVLLLILDYFNPIRYENDFKRCQAIFHMTRVNRYFRDLLCSDSIYEQWWKRYITNALPSMEKINKVIGGNLVPRSKMRLYYFHTIKLIDRESFNYKQSRKETLSLAISEGYEKVFDMIFDEKDYTKDEDRKWHYAEYFDECLKEGHRPVSPSDFIWDNIGLCNRVIDALFELALQQSNTYFMHRILNTRVFIEELNGLQYHCFLTSILDKPDILKLLLEKDEHRLENPHLNVSVLYTNFNGHFDITRYDGNEPDSYCLSRWCHRMLNGAEKTITIKVDMKTPGYVILIRRLSNDEYDYIPVVNEYPDPAIIITFT